MIKSLKGRRIDYKRPVRVYRNLNRRDAVWYSIMQKKFCPKIGRRAWLVVGYAKELMLTNTKFFVSEKGRQRVLKEGRKNIHAYVEGFISTNGAMGVGPDVGLHVKIEYNPYKHKNFVTKNFTPASSVWRSMAACFNQDGASVAYFYGDKL